MEATESKPESFVFAKPQKEHFWFQKLVGEWTYHTEPHGGSGEVYRGTETVRTIGGIWLLAEGTGDLPGGGTAHTFMTLGYDPVKTSYVGTWVGSMMTHLWVYKEGALDADARVLSLRAEGPSMSGDGSLGQYRDVIELVSDDHRTLKGFTLDGESNWNHFMTTHYRRK